MDNVYREAYAEVLEVIRKSDENIKRKIPEKFITFLNQNEDKNYIVKIDFNNENWENYVKDETQAILALMYRDYIVSPEKRKKLLEEENEELINVENELREKYKPDAIFKKYNREQQINEDVISNNAEMIEYKDSIFKKIINIIKGLFHKI